MRIACEQAFGGAGNYFFPQTESLLTGYMRRTSTKNEWNA